MACTECLRGDWSILVFVVRVIPLPPSLSDLTWQLLIQIFAPSSLEVARELRKVGSKEMRQTEIPPSLNRPSKYLTDEFL